MLVASLKKNLLTFQNAIKLFRWCTNYLCMYETMHELFSKLCVYIPCTHSTFIANNGNDGGAVSTAYLPLSFRGSNTFEENRGRTFVVCMAISQVYLR